MITGDISASYGDAYLSSHSVTWSLKDAQSRFGYCPQFDALIDQLTVRETMYMYARLRGVAESSIAVSIDNIISMAMLYKHRNKQAGNLRSEVVEFYQFFRILLPLVFSSIQKLMVRHHSRLPSHPLYSLCVSLSLSLPFVPCKSFPHLYLLGDPTPAPYIKLESLRERCKLP